MNWYPRPELNGDQRFRKPLLYPFELRGLHAPAILNTLRPVMTVTSASVQKNRKDAHPQFSITSLDLRAAFHEPARPADLG